ncbi:hypothetical protein [Paraconexibacter algicola]|uniref:Uncharacterized protein n=1 Tax=Paraconexibacter algicola TaxID=2133960 RepID=A0A2T4UIC5_9ACTN|nr:hypothetical protein [Paraconexibacter algicola]PTL58996.1 hypothetical protein C7Y72_04705 [Paraconexibacter algicola]
MRPTRVILASLGTGMSLVLVGVLLLASVSTVVAFKGWPGGAPQLPDTPAAMLADAGVPVQADTVAARTALVVPEAPPTARAAVRAPRRTAVPQAIPAPTDTHVEVTRRPARKVTGNGAVMPAREWGDGPGETAPAQKKPARRRPATEVVREVGAGLGGALDTTVSEVGAKLDPVSPTLGQTVDDTGQVVGDTVQGVTNTVSDILDALKPRR